VQQYGVKVHDKDIVVGEYSVDLLVDDVPLVELETFKALDHPTCSRAPDAMHRYLKTMACNFACCAVSARSSEIQRVAMADERSRKNLRLLRASPVCACAMIRSCSQPHEAGNPNRYSTRLRPSEPHRSAARPANPCGIRRK
jgi:hypothetical protein